MLKFIKENSYTIFKMIVNQIGMTIFGLSLFAAATIVPESWSDFALAAVSIFSVIFYLVLLYTMTWDIGASEKIRIEGNRLRYVPLKGLYISLCANIFNIIFAIVALVGYYGATAYNTSGAPMSPEWSVNVFGIGNVFVKFLEAMYAGLISVISPNNPWLFLAIIIPALVTCLIAYIMGVKGKHFTPIVGETKSRE